MGYLLTCFYKFQTQHKNTTCNKKKPEEESVNSKFYIKTSRLNFFDYAHLITGTVSNIQRGNDSLYVHSIKTKIDY